jgi:hypothetical protein
MKRLFCVVSLLGVSLVGCGPNEDSIRHIRRDGGVDFSGFGMTCNNPPKDTDDDGISDLDEGAAENPPRDTDHDGTPDYKDQDSDNDGIPDFVEGRNGNPCTKPVDSDSDGVPDFRDLDSDDAMNASIPDKQEAGPEPSHPIDTNGDGKPDYMDPDNDGDHILDIFELTPQGQAVAVTVLANAPDTDGDGVPDFLDTDSDNDTILDGDDGVVDTDGDLVPNFRDTDSDNDCVLDSAEAGDADPMTPPVDTDGDGAPDFEDVDSDNDGLRDNLEDKNCNGQLDVCETNRLNPDTDGDTVSDLIEYEDCQIKPMAIQQMEMCQCDGSDPNKSPLTRGDFVFTSDYMKTTTPSVETLQLSTNVSQADVVFDIDVTGSMGACATNLAANLATGVVGQVQAKVKNVAFGLVGFMDFTDPWVVQYKHRIQTVNTMAGVMSVKGALDAVTTGFGGDGPEAGWESLYSIAGGPPDLSGTGPSGTVWNSKFNLAATPPTTPTAGEMQGTLYGAGFRPGSVPIVVIMSDADWHDAPGVPANGEDGLYDYGSGTDCPSGCTNVPSRAATITRLNAIGAHVVGLAVEGGGYPDNRGHYRELAKATAAVVKPEDFGPTGARACGVGACCTGPGGSADSAIPAGSPCPLAYDVTRTTVGGQTVCPVSDAIVSGIVALANGLKFDVHVVAADVDPGTVDNFIDRLEPNVSGMGPAAMCLVIDPMLLQDNFIGPKAAPKPPPPAPGDGVKDTFVGIGGATQICFDVVPKMNTTVDNTDMPQIFRAQLQVKGVAAGNTFNLGTPRDVFFLVPPVIRNGPIN